MYWKWFRTQLNVSYSFASITIDLTSMEAKLSIAFSYLPVLPIYVDILIPNYFILTCCICICFSFTFFSINLANYKTCLFLGGFVEEMSLAGCWL